ncbi:MAG TPA: peptidoglycan editing factor PgeF [Acidobacteriaceae bacterium]
MPWLVHGFSTRTGGMTTVYGSGDRPTAALGELNLGLTADDDPEAVRANREFLLEALGGPVPPALAGLVTLRQTHSATVHRVDRSDVLGPGERAVLEGDGLMTDEPGVLLGIQTADCVPVLVADTRRRAVAGFHAGWRGTLVGIVQEGIGRLREEFGSAPEDLLAAVGPAIGACCYRVGEDVREQFAARFRYADQLFRHPDPGSSGQSAAGGFHLDLAEANCLQLMDAGLRRAAIHRTGACTSCNTGRFFSYRGENGRTGRMMAVIGVR